MRIDFHNPLNCNGMTDSQAIQHITAEFRKLQEVFMRVNGEVEELKQKVQELEDHIRFN